MDDLPLDEEGESEAIDEQPDSWNDRTRVSMENNPHYAPENLLDMLQQLLGLENDRQLADRLKVQPPQISKIRWRKTSVSAALLISMHEETNLSLVVLRGLMGDYRESTAATATHPVEPPLLRLQLQQLSMLPRLARPGPAPGPTQREHISIS
jgi:hypothetical protein